MGLKVNKSKPPTLSGVICHDYSTNDLAKLLKSGHQFLVVKIFTKVLDVDIRVALIEALVLIPLLSVNELTHIPDTLRQSIVNIGKAQSNIASQYWKKHSHFLVVQQHSINLLDGKIWRFLGVKKHKSKAFR